MIGISACLGGTNCRYDGSSEDNDDLMVLVTQKKAVIVCPEVLGGLSTPRNPAEIVGGDGFSVWNNQAKVMDNQGTDVTDIYKSGSKKAFEKLVEAGIRTLVLKENSPSCGVHLIYDGTFSGTKKVGVGVATAYFINKGLKVYGDVEWDKMQKRDVKKGKIDVGTT